MLRYEILLPIATGLIILSIILLECEKVRSLLLSLMLQAKRLAKDYILNSGQAQENWVVEKAMILLPKYITLFLSEDITRMIVKEIFYEIKDYFDDQHLNNSIKK